ncbi:MAG: nucleoside hydrolase [Chloroflexia bacterium]|nr:nucleoside hydrolase [Chloroflexia bacterium]
MERRRVVLDVDVGIDDAAMMLFLAAEPGVEIVAVGSTHGNCTAAQAATNALRVLEVVGLGAARVPVAPGAESPLADPHRAAHVHGHDGLADLGLPPPRGAPGGESAVDQLLRLSRQQPGQLDLLAVGAMTNLAAALARDPDVLRRFRRVVVLAAYARAPRPGDPVTVDANTAADPAAAEALFASGSPLTVVPVDTTNFSVLDDDHIRRLREAATPQARFAWAILPFYFDFYRTVLGRWTARMHDPLVAAVLLHPSLVRATVHRPIFVEPWDGPHRAVGREGAELAGLPPRAPVAIVTAVDQRRFLDRFVDALVTPLGALPPAGDGVMG